MLAWHPGRNRRHTVAVPARNARWRPLTEAGNCLHTGFDRVSTPCHSVAVITKRHPSLLESTVSPRPRLSRDAVTVAIVGPTSWKRLDTFRGQGSVDTFDVAHVVTDSNTTAFRGDVERRGIRFTGRRLQRSPSRSGDTAVSRRLRLGPHTVTSGDTERDRRPYSRPVAGHRRPVRERRTPTYPHPAAHVEAGGIVSRRRPC